MRNLRELESVEHTGFGVPTIVKHYGKEAFEILDGFVKVTIPFENMELKELLDKDETVLFAGAPCQVASLKKY